MARAAAHGRTSVARFQDPTALALLPEDARARVERYREGAPKGLRAGLESAFLDERSKIMVARTVEIDDALRGGGAGQVVILGAGLDGRAWRMPELRDVTVFEVDHPDSQREKRARVASLTPVARDVRFVPVDFTRDRLDDALTGAGHDRERATTWVWEGVVMYLTPAEVESTLAVIARRSAQGSRLVVMYFRPAPMMRIVGPVVRWLGEPFRSSFEPDVMHALLEKYGFDVGRDADLPAIGSSLSPEIGRATRRMRHMRIATADRRT